MPRNKPVLIVAQSGRALTASAAKAKITAHVIDRFADSDTRTVAASCQAVAGKGQDFDAEQLQSALMQFATVPLAGVITGSGLEAQPELLDWIAQRWPLIGNPAEVIRSCKEPGRFFALLDRLRIPYPDVRLVEPDAEPGWLLKQTGGAGGAHISAFSNEKTPAANCYLQQKITGRAMSIVILANGTSARLLGINETWAVAPDRDDYRYAGAISLTRVDNKLYAALMDITATLVRALQLRGLCGIDLIVDHLDRCYVLEVNPRPTATFELHETGDSLLQAHIAACTGRLPSIHKQQTACRAHRIVYTGTALQIPAIDWPEWVSDRPVPGKQVAAGMPVCTIHAGGTETDSDTVKSQLASRTRILHKLIGQYQLAA